MELLFVRHVLTCDVCGGGGEAGWWRIAALTVAVEPEV
jgi:hypothetical protein